MGRLLPAGWSSVYFLNVLEFWSLVLNVIPLYLRCLLYDCAVRRRKNTLAYQIISLRNTNFRNLVFAPFNSQIPHLFKEMFQQGVQKKNTPQDGSPSYSVHFISSSYIYLRYILQFSTYHL